LHHHAFKAATIIYYHQIFDDVLPQDLSSYVHEVHDSLAAFSETHGGNYTLWPAFIAAVEAYTEDDQCKFRSLLKKGTHGIKNRITATRLIEHVWEARKSIAITTSLGPGEIRVDWKKVKQDLQMDILVV
jgi:hypothetical protein